LLFASATTGISLIEHKNACGYSTKRKKEDISSKEKVGLSHSYVLKRRFDCLSQVSRPWWLQNFPSLPGKNLLENLETTLAPHYLCEPVTQTTHRLHIAFVSGDRSHISAPPWKASHQVWFLRPHKWRQPQTHPL
jgi:hypothetical protein